MCDIKTLELFRIQMTSLSGRRFCVYIVYHPPSGTKLSGTEIDFYSDFDILFTEASISTLSVMILGDFNIHYKMRENFRYLSYKYNLSPTLWISPLCNIYKCINDYVTDFIVTPDISHFIRELCICRDSGDFSVLTSTEMSQLIEYICTI